MYNFHAFRQEKRWCSSERVNRGHAHLADPTTGIPRCDCSFPNTSAFTFLPRLFVVYRITQAALSRPVFEDPLSCVASYDSYNRFIARARCAIATPYMWRRHTKRRVYHWSLYLSIYMSEAYVDHIVQLGLLYYGAASLLKTNEVFNRRGQFPS